MISSAGDAFRLLNKWKAEAPEIFAVFTTPDCEFSCKGRLHSIEGSKIQIASPTSSLELDLAGATFVYEDPRESPEQIRESMEIQYVCELKITLLNGDKCGLFEKASLA